MPKPNQSFNPSLIQILPLLLICFLAGCAKVAHLQELLTLKNLSEDRDQQEIKFSQQQKNFSKLLKAVSANSLKHNLNQAILVKEFGQPNTIRAISEDEKLVSLWIYKDPEKQFSSPKVYFYMDPSGKCQRWEYFPRNAASNESEMEQALLDDSGS